MPRVAALLDTSQVSDIIKVISSDTFLRPIYAGNAFATVKSTDSKKCITIRPTSFDPAATSGGSAEIVKADAGEASTFIKFIKSTCEIVRQNRLIIKYFPLISHLYNCVNFHSKLFNLKLFRI